VNALKEIRAHLTAEREEPEPPSGAARAHSLVDVLELAAKAGLAITAEEVIAAIRRGRVSPDAERAVEHASAADGLKVVNEPCDVPAAPAGDANGGGGLRRALGATPT